MIWFNKSNKFYYKIEGGTAYFKGTNKCWSKSAHSVETLLACVREGLCIVYEGYSAHVDLENK